MGFNDVNKINQNALTAAGVIKIDSLRFFILIVLFQTSLLVIHRLSRKPNWIPFCLHPS